MAELIKIDVDKARDKYNYENPLNPIKGRRDLLDRIDSNVSEITLYNWSKGRTPDGFGVVSKICELTSMTFDEILTKEKI